MALKIWWDSFQQILEFQQILDSKIWGKVRGGKDPKLAVCEPEALPVPALGLRGVEIMG